ncbi:MAG: DUF3617 domain-containing protein [Sphingomonas sp.]|uniref:DUF3617 domain-containing protein n=1 Tax=Sphingomonas sp. TaxID=28214 RepID=UPI001B273EAC|nr:DUF3617 domain-containing protein [Sphingomonas sp.]MBO9623640.1 DUF3617 domain-containing protein [Sphingomonas sp.]
MKHLVVLAPMALAACNSGPSVDVTNASVNEVSEQVAAAGGAQFLNAGRWEGTGGITEMTIEGLTPEQSAKMKEEMAKEEKKFVSCLTEEEAKKPAASFFAGDQGDCRYDRFTMRNGVIDGEMTCKSEEGIEHKSTIKGSFSSDSFSMAMTSKSAGKPGVPMSAYTMTLKMDAKHVGACKGDEDGSDEG